MQRAQETSRTHIVTLERTEEWPSTWCRTDWPASSQGRPEMWVDWHRTAHTDKGRGFNADPCSTLSAAVPH